ncbi:hypothetical protein B0487_2126 [Bifidobacterium adolescentis]|uniref:Uncharacterized protein n=1 Tax=Bifidobacterium adolescentis TaxID=1680 RepID=A0A1X2YR49_BIFAD|nr:hypothetical protein B0487_2126 [Bifidobacterium adolescentis]
MPTTLIIVAAVAILIILLATASYKVCPADRVMVKSSRVSFRPRSWKTTSATCSRLWTPDTISS